jgi:hypothetical protein
MWSNFQQKIHFSEQPSNKLKHTTTTTTTATTATTTTTTTTTTTKNQG